MVSPFSMWFSTICRASWAYSLGSPRRDGNGTWAPRLFCASADSPIIIGVRKRPGAIVQRLAREPRFVARLGPTRGAVPAGA